MYFTVYQFDLSVPYTPVACCIIMKILMKDNGRETNNKSRDMGTMLLTIQTLRSVPLILKVYKSLLKKTMTYGWQLQNASIVDPWAYTYFSQTSRMNFHAQKVKKNWVQVCS